MPSWKRTCIYIGFLCAVAKSTCADLGSACNTADEQPVCTVMNSECLDNFCKCKQGYKEVDVACVKELNNACNTANEQPECTVTNSECQDDVCKCKQGYREVDAACEKELNNACNTANGQPECTVTNSECQGDMCKCKQGYREVDAACVKAVSDIKCTVGTECDNIPNAECDETAQMCKCSDGYVMNINVCDPENAATTLRIEAATLLVFVILAVVQIAG